LVSVPLAALLAAELVRISLIFFGGDPLRSAVPVAQGAAPAAGKSRVDVRSIVAEHLFGMAADDANQDPANAPATTANLVLVGTLAKENPRQGLAIITAEGPARVYRVGEEVSGASLHSVYRDRVTLDRGGRLETLILPRLLLPVTTMAVRQPVQQTPGGATTVADTRPGLKDPRSLADVMRAEPSVDNQAGTLRGFRIYSGRNRSAFNGSGLRAGDLVTAVNGTPLADQDRRHAQEVFDTIQTGRATVTIVRNNKTQDISIDMAP
jgi:general secretion pathway protein C